MVFSFFKKAPEKMVAKPAAVPRPKDGARPPQEASPSPAAAATTAAESGEASDFSDFVFSESATDFQIEGDIDPVDAEVEEAAILFANSQDDVARAALENAVRKFPFGPGERLWLMLFDLYRLLGQKAAFEALEIDYVRSFEKTPPPWRDTSLRATKGAEVAAGSQPFRGDLTSDNDAAFVAVQQALGRNPKLRLDVSKVGKVDAGGCARLLDTLQTAKKARPAREIELVGRECLAALIGTHIETGSPENAACWLLLLELQQLQGLHDAFEETAINYAVTFEVSPPSWEARRVAAPETPIAEGEAPKANSDAFVLNGEIRASRFADLMAYAERYDVVVIDCAALRRIDFVSAGTLFNLLSSIRRTGKPIIFRHPNHLVAELFGVVGLTAVATVVFAKH